MAETSRERAASLKVWVIELVSAMSLPKDAITSAMPLKPRVAILSLDSLDGDLLSCSSFESLERDRNQRTSKIFKQKWYDVCVEDDKNITDIACHSRPVRGSQY